MDNPDTAVTVNDPKSYQLSVGITTAGSQSFQPPDRQQYDCEFYVSQDDVFDETDFPVSNPFGSAQLDQMDERVGSSTSVSHDLSSTGADDSLILGDEDGGRFCDTGTAFLIVRVQHLEGSSHTDPDPTNDAMALNISLTCFGGLCYISVYFHVLACHFAMCYI